MVVDHARNDHMNDLKKQESFKKKKKKRHRAFWGQ